MNNVREKKKSQKEIFLVPTETDGSFDENLTKKGRLSNLNNIGNVNNVSGNNIRNNNSNNNNNYSNNNINYSFDASDRCDYSNYDDNDEMIIDNPPIEMKKEIKKEVKKAVKKIITSSEKERIDTISENTQKLRNKLIHFDMILNRACGVVGGRSVTMPENEVSW